MLTVDTLVKTYKARKGADDVPAVNEVSLDIERGKVLTLLGPSGSARPPRYVASQDSRIPTAAASSSAIR